MMSSSKTLKASRLIVVVLMLNLSPEYPTINSNTSISLTNLQFRKPCETGLPIIDEIETVKTQILFTVDKSSTQSFISSSKIHINSQI
ncbi:unnamed protein product [Heterobilharzia americana]|nr:unnamed protein product [Heterobilharzia americana]